MKKGLQINLRIGRGCNALISPRLQPAGDSKGHNQTAAGMLPWIAGIGLMLMASLIRADAGVVTARTSTITTRLSGYARVEPIALLELNAARSGVITGLKVLPGDPVDAGSELGRLTGPMIEDVLAQRRSDVDGARAVLTAAQKVLAIERQQHRAHLVDQKAVDRATAALADAQTRLENARSQMRAVQEAVILKAPADGSVLAVKAADGEQVQAGQTILTLQPKERLWLRAVYYGSEAAAVRIGMTGRFEPAGGAAAIPVRVRSVIGTQAPDGGQAVGLIATVPAPDWRSGETGLTTLQGPEQTFVMVPTRALILDRGKWWVVVRTDQGNRPREVVPGPSRGESTLLERGIEAGARIVVENAYLEFHREFSKFYSPPD
jgi:RND family efflux transporter MFP subunit